MWSKLPPRFVARMLSGHTVVGLAASVLLYVLCLSGTVMVFHEEFARWEQPGSPEFQDVQPAAVHAAALNGLERVEERPHHFFIAMPVENMPRMTVTADETSWYANANGELVETVSHPWAHFLEKLHYYLTLPGVLGLTLVGILGVLMTTLVISGVLAHPKLFRDAFKLRTTSSDRLRETDTHNRLGAWAAPFHIVIAFTGAALGLASIVAYLLAPMSESGKFEDFFAPIFGAEVEGSKDAAPLADIETALVNFKAEHPDLVPWYVSFHDPATEGQSAEILAKHPRRLVYGDNYHFEQDGTLTGSTGLSDGDIGQQVAASLYPLHFGSFGGIWVKLAYGILGVLASVVTASGINIWLLKRRQRGRAVPLLERAWPAVVWGSPAAMALVLLQSVAGIDAMAVHIATFWLSLLVLMVAAMAWPALKGIHLRWLTGGLLVAVLAAHLAQHANEFESPAAFGVSVVLAAVALWLLRDLPRRQSLRLAAAER